MSMFIKDSVFISAQETFTRELFRTGAKCIEGQVMNALEPPYTMLPKNQLRRMGKASRMALGAGLPLLEQYQVDGIIFGTSDGGMADCHRFLKQIMEYDEGTLTPTGFVSGAPSAIAGSLALLAGNQGYNNTHSNQGLSFENALVDAIMLFDESEAEQLLVGAVDELSEAQFRIEQLAGMVKEGAGSSATLMDSKTPGTMVGEGAALFVCSNSPEDAQVEVVDVDVACISEGKALDKFVSRFLARNEQSGQKIELVMLGRSGDVEHDKWYKHLIQCHFPETTTETFKDLFGECRSSSAFGTWLATQYLQGKRIPQRNGSIPEMVQQVLIYNHFQGEQHSLQLLRRVDR